MARDVGTTPFEVYCQSCRVSFPVGTRSCVHCGQRLGRPGLRRRAEPELHPAMRPTQSEGPDPGDLAEEDLQTRSGVMSPVAILWVALLLGGAIYRACA